MSAERQGDDRKEGDRLDDQHDMVLSIMGGSPIHDSIPLSELQAIADAATGTGIWLRAARQQLEHASSLQGPSRFHGFDILADHFPQEPGQMHYSVQNILEPFAEEFNDTFDLVHVRFINGSISETQMRTALSNLLSIIKPGGYLQWDEVCLGKGSQTHADEYPRALEIIHNAFTTPVGFSWDAPEFIHKISQEAGMQNVRKYDYDSALSTMPNKRLQQWSFAWLPKLLPVVVLKSGETDPEVVKVKVAEMIKELEDLYSIGVNINWAFGTVVGQKRGHI